MDPEPDENDNYHFAECDRMSDSICSCDEVEREIRAEFAAKSREWAN